MVESLSKTEYNELNDDVLASLGLTIGQCRFQYQLTVLSYCLNSKQLLLKNLLPEFTSQITTLIHKAQSDKKLVKCKPLFYRALRHLTRKEGSVLTIAENYWQDIA